MYYRVTTPFIMNGERLGRGTKLGSEIEERINFPSLLKDKYIERMFDKKTGENFVEHCYIAIRGFTGKGIHYKPGDLVDLRGQEWRNEKALLDSSYLRHATEEEVARHSSLSPLDTPVAGSPTRPGVHVWSEMDGTQREKWLRKRYLKDRASIPELEKEAKCSRSTIWNALKNYGIETRPRGRPVKTEV